MRSRSHSVEHAALTGAVAGLEALGRVRVDVDSPTSNEMLWAADIVAWGAYGVGRMRVRPGRSTTQMRIRRVRAYGSATR